MSFCFRIFLCMVMRLKQQEIKFKQRIKLNHNKYIIHIIPATYLYTFQNKEFNALRYKSRNVLHYTYFHFSFIFSHAFGRFPFFLFTYIGSRYLRAERATHVNRRCTFFLFWQWFCPHFRATCLYKSKET